MAEEEISTLEYIRTWAILHVILHSALAPIEYMFCMIESLGIYVFYVIFAEIIAR